MPAKRAGSFPSCTPPGNLRCGRLENPEHKGLALVAPWAVFVQACVESARCVAVVVQTSVDGILNSFDRTEKPPLQTALARPADDWTVAIHALPPR